MLRTNIIRNILTTLFLGALSCNAFAGGDALPPKKMIWPFEGPFGQVDRQAAQRGFQVYKEVCATCHALNKLAYRNLKDIGFSEAEVKEIAKAYSVKDYNDVGEVIERPARISDKFVPPYANEAAARAANNGAYPVDLSLIVKARENGANYLYSILTGYMEAPKDFHLMSGLSYNPFFPGRQIAMPAPLTAGQVEYMDGTQATVEQMAKDLVVFLQWAAEPEMEHRKSLGLRVMIYLIVFTVLFYIAMNRIWAKLKN
ncbi:MAG: cytochrome c1, heme protein precursor [Rickettsiaceae bacterium]|jgi:ubiquinol-cytochrome c reductase cytochrome c1 subunit|nr:cytochrome c1, heme protein precursor [Rickettsiaceae bacterium]